MGELVHFIGYRMFKFQKTGAAQTQFTRLEPLVLIAVSAHGVVILTILKAQPRHWFAVGMIALVGALSLFVRQAASLVNIRALSILIVGWMLMSTTGGAGSFFLLWYFVLVSIYPLLLGRLQGFLILGAAPIFYIMLIPISPGPLSLAVVLSRAFLLAFIGWITWEASGILRRSTLQLETTVAELGTLYAATKDLSSSLEPQIVLRELARHLTEALAATSGYIMQVDPSCETLTVLAEYWGEKASSRERKSDLSRDYALRDFPATRRAITEHRVTALQADDPDLSSAEKGQLEEYGIQSALLVPIVLAGDVIGQAEIWDSARTRRFTPKELDLVRMLASQAAGPIMNARLYEKSRQHEAQLAALLNIAQTLSSSLEIEEVLAYVTHSLTSALQMEQCAISEYDPVNRSVCTLTVYTTDGHPSNDAEVGASYALSDYPATARVIDTGESLIVRANDPGTDPLEVALLRHYGRMMLLMLPLHIGSRTIGIIELYTSNEQRELASAEIHLAHTIADQVAVAIENARLFTETKKLSGVVEQTADNVYICDRNGAIEYVNHAFEEVTGYAKEEVIGQTPRILKSGQHPQEFYTNLWDTILDGKVFHSQLINRKKDGRLYYELKTITPIKDAQGNITHFVSTGRDITELSALYNLSRSLAEAGYDTDTILNLTVRYAVEAVHVTFARVGLAENGYCVIECAYPARLPDRELNLLGQRERIEDLPTCFRVAQRNEPIIFRFGDPNLTGKESGMLFWGGAQTVCLIPLRVGKRVLGLLMLSETRSEEREPITPEKVRLARSIGDQVASALRRAELFAELEEAYLQTVYALANAVDARDTYTANHAQRLATMVLAIGQELGLDPQELEDLHYGAILHDIGKIGIPDAILRKQIKLDAEEWAIMRQHPEIGARILAPIPRLAGAAKIVHHHHERFDGKGYPEGLAGKAIPLGARILTVVDAYSAIRDERVYKSARSPQDAIEELKRNAGTQLDPHIVEIFLRVLQQEAFE